MSGDQHGATPLSAGRILGLDMWRALLMSGGLFVHGSVGLPATALFAAIGDISQAFRMGVFFILSGFLASIVLRRRDRLAWLRGRIVHLGVPAAFGVLVLSPLIWWLFGHHRGTGPGVPTFPFEWHHLWFLFGLLAYAAAAVGLDAADRASGMIGRMEARTGGSGGRVAMLLTAAAAALLLAAAVPLLQASLSPAQLRAFGIAQLIPGYLPMFVLGFVLARADRLRLRVTCATRFAVGIVAAVILANILARQLPALSGLVEHVRFVGAVLCPPACFALVLRSALHIRRVPALVVALSEASYTIYLLHFPIVVALSTQVVGGWEPHLAYATNVLVAGGGAFLFHRAVVRHVPLLSLLLNGKVLRRAGGQRTQLAAAA